MLSGFGVLALLLAAVGLYGVIAYRTSLRTREIGVRIALGADPRAIFREVVWRGLMIAVLGVAVGEALAAAAVRALGAVEMGIRPAALSVHLSAAVIWVTAASLACYRPASRASRIPPMEALRHE